MANYWVLEGFEECVAATDLLAGPLQSMYGNMIAAVTVAPATSPNRGSGQSVALQGTNVGVGGSGSYYVQYATAYRAVGVNNVTVKVGAALALASPVAPSGSAMQGVILALYDGTTMQLFVMINPSGVVSLNLGNPTTYTTIATAAVPVNPAVMNFIEIAATIGATGVGAASVWVNQPAGGTPAIAVSGVATQTSANANVNGVGLGIAVGIQNYYSVSWPIGTALGYFDDLYVGDTQMGNMHVNTYVPSANGTYTQWTPSSGANYADVDALPLQTTTYILAPSAGLIDTYPFVGFGTNAPVSVAAVAASFCGTSPAGASVVAPALLSNSVLTLGTSFSLSGSGNTYGSVIFSTDPGRSNAAWTPTNVAALQFGVERIS